MTGAAPRRLGTREAVIGLVAVNAAWGASFPLMKASNLFLGKEFGLSLVELESAAAGPFVFTMVNFLLAVRFLAAFVLLAAVQPQLYRRQTAFEISAGAAIGGLFTTGLVLQCAGLVSIPASQSGFLTSLSIVFTPIFVAVLLRRRPSYSVALAAALALLGVAVLTDQVGWPFGASTVNTSVGGSLRAGHVLTVIAALLFTGQILVLDRMGKRADSTRFTPAMFLAAGGTAAVLFFASLFARGDSLRPWLVMLARPEFLAFIGVLVVLCSILAFLGMNRFQPAISAEQAAVVYTLEPIFTSLWAMFLPGWIAAGAGIAYANEVPTWTLMVGGALIVAANWAAFHGDAPQSADP